MHTASQIQVEMFECAVGGASVLPLEVLGDFDHSSRLGVVMTDPFGAVGASLLIQLYILGFYELRPERRLGDATYPEIYLFHCGGQFGSHSAFDFWPRRREVFISAQPEDVLAGLNSHAITHVLVPEGVTGGEVGWGYTDPGAAYDRIQACYTYSPSGRVQNSDENISIHAIHEALIENTNSTIRPETHVRYIEEALAGHSDPIAEEYLGVQKNRLNEVARSTRETIFNDRVEIAIDGLPMETYREISIDECLARLSGLAANA